MATGLSGLISNTGTQTTTLPSWFDTAQQNVVNQATAANAGAPTPQQTVGQQAVNTLSGPTNPFTQAGGTLQSIASGAASPWNVSPEGQVSPNTGTALGGLFQAQNQQLQQLLPTQLAQTQAGNIGSGNFGSLRGQTAMDTAAANAQANLFTQQMQAALQNQATGVQAGAQAGNVAQQDINNLLTTGQYQQSSPYINAANLANVLSTVQPGATVSNTTNLSPLNQVMGLATALGGASSGGLLGTIFGTSGNNQPQYLPNGALNPAYQAGTKGILDYFSSSNPSSNSGNLGGYTPGQTQAAIDATTAANMAPANPNSTLDPSTIVSDE
jgi:hypothetical protein